MTLNQSTSKYNKFVKGMISNYDSYLPIFLGVKLCKFNVLYHPTSSQRYDTSASDVILNPNILREYSFKMSQIWT